MKRTSVKVFKGGIRVEGKCYRAVPVGENGEGVRNPLIEYNNNIVTAKDGSVFDSEKGNLIGRLVEVSPKHFQYYMDANNNSTRRVCPKPVEIQTEATA